MADAQASFVSWPNSPQVSTRAVKKIVARSSSSSSSSRLRVFFSPDRKARRVEVDVGGEDGVGSFDFLDDVVQGEGQHLLHDRRRHEVLFQEARDRDGGRDDDGLRHLEGRRRVRRDRRRRGGNRRRRARRRRRRRRRPRGKHRRQRRRQGRRQRRRHHRRIRPRHRSLVGVVRVAKLLHRLELATHQVTHALELAERAQLAGVLLSSRELAGRPPPGHVRQRRRRRRRRLLQHQQGRLREGRLLLQHGGRGRRDQEGREDQSAHLQSRRGLSIFHTDTFLA
mmetsp:Transcript_26101/g.84492  ORF Transcript_26101/g.84492 Transcript_26101/m.84492 type:complete len:282 (+) Transcript_26101:592-1437(+)